MMTVKRSHIVKPADLTPHEIMCVSDLDQTKPLSHAPLIYFYRPTRESVKDAFHVLKDSLSKALVIFYPFAGRLHWIGGGRVELHCNSMGALLLEAETKLKIDDFGDFRPNPEITALLPSVDLDATPLQEVPLLMIQLTKFACGGLSLGLKFSHIAVDGRSALHFVTEWKKLAAGGKSIDLPFFDRSVLQAREPLASLPTLNHSQLNPPPLLIGHSDNLEERKKPTTVIMLKLSKEQTQKLKNKANQNIEVDKHSSSHGFTRFEAVAAHVWRCASKARRHKSEQKTACYVTVDSRNRMKPPLPPRYFGNAVFLVPAIATAGDLLSRPLGHATGKIREAIKSVTNEYVSAYLISSKNLSDVSGYRHSHIVGHLQGAFFGNPNIAITSWIGLPLCDLDFGWGKEIFMGPGALGYDGRGFFIASHGGDGSFFIPLRLQVEHADAFLRYFYEEIDYHSLSSHL